MFEDYELVYPGYSSLSEEEKQIVKKAVTGCVAVFFPSPDSGDQLTEDVLRKALDAALRKVSGLSYDEVFGKSRERCYVELRQMIFYACRKKFGNTFEYWGRFFKKNYSTILYSINVVEGLLSISRSFAKEYNQIYDEIEQYLDQAGLCEKGRSTVVL